MKRPAKRTRSALIAWAGIVDGKIDLWKIDEGRGQLAIWATRAEVRRRYQGVRKVKITFVAASRSGRARA